MNKLIFSSAALALALAATPASAQLLGGGGGLGGGLGGSVGGLGGSGMGTLRGTMDGTISRVPVTSDTIGSARTSTRTERSVDTRKGRVTASNRSSADGTLDSATRIGDRTIGGSASGSGSAGGDADAQLIGTDAVRSTAGSAVSRTRDATDRVRNTAGTAVGRARDTAGNALSRTSNLGGSASGSGSASGGGSGSLSALDGAASGAGNLALAGSGAANAGAFPVNPGMIVTDAKGRAIGTVQSVRSTARGTVQRVLVKVGDKTANLPASNFSGSGNVLVSAMGKGDVKDAAD